MWMRLSNGREELIVNEDHVKRLKGEGAVEIDDPRTPQPETSAEQPSQEGVTNASTSDDGGSESTGASDDQRSGDDTTVHRPASSGQTRRSQK